MAAGAVPVEGGAARGVLTCISPVVLVSGIISWAPSPGAYLLGEISIQILGPFVNLVVLAEG